MDGLTRFTKTMSLETPDRPPLFEDGIRDEVIRRWHKQGLSRQDRLENLFSFDYREEIEPNLEPMPTPNRWPTRMEGLSKFAKRLDPGDPERMPDQWDNKIVEWKKRDYPLILRIHRGYFLTMGVHGWRRFTDAIQLLVDDPGLVEAWMELYSQFACQIAEKILSEVEVDAVLFSEPIGGNHGPLISPAMYAALILKSYLPIIEVCKSHQVETLIYRTYANTRVLLPSVLNAGFNCLWSCECDKQAMNYSEIRREFGKVLRLIGGIDSDALRRTKEDIYRAVMEVVPPLLEDGGYIPLADGRVREDVPYDNYVYYRGLLDTITRKI